MGSSQPTAVIAPEKAMQAFAASQAELPALHKTWEAAMKKPDLHFEEPLHALRLLISFVSLIHTSTDSQITDWVDKNKAQFLDSATVQSPDQMLATSSTVIITKFKTQTELMSTAITRLDSATVSARTEQTHLGAILTALGVRKQYLTDKEAEENKLIDNQKNIIQTLQKQADSAEQESNAAQKEIDRAKKQAEEYAELRRSPWAASAGAMDGIDYGIGVAEGNAKSKKAALDSITAQMNASKTALAEAITKATSLNADKMAVHNQAEETTKAVTACNAAATDAGGILSQIQALHDPWKSIQGGVVNLITWAGGLDKQSKHFEHLVFEVHVLRLLNHTLALQDEPGVRNVCSLILDDIAARNEWVRSDAVAKTAVQESIIRPYLEIKTRLGLNRQEQKSLTPLLESSFPDSLELVDFS